MINPMVVEGQIAGGVAQGIGGALYEEMAYDEDGNPLATTFLDYLIPTAAEAPTSSTATSRRPRASLGGYKGIGEGGAIASPPRSPTRSTTPSPRWASTSPASR